MNTRTRVKAIPALVLAGMATSMLAYRTSAQDPQATPEAGTNPYADLGLPELDLDFTSAAVTGIPESIEAGRYLVTIHGEPGPEDYAFAPLFLQLPDGMTMDDAMAEAGASPDAPPSFYFDSVLAGGPAIMGQSGETSAVAVVDFPPGNWFVAGSALSQPPVPFTVTGEMPADLPEPESTATFSLGEMEIKITEGDLMAGENLLRIDNVGTLPHQIEVEKLPDGTTREVVQNTLDVEMSGTPVGEVLDFNEIVFAGISGDQSAGISMWMPLTLEAGTYGIFCFLPDPETGMPHAYMGMWDLFEVS